MLRVKQIKLKIDQTEKDLKTKIAQKLKIKENDILNLIINKKSLDARDKNNLIYVYEIDINVKNEQSILKKHLKDVTKTPDETYKLPKSGNKVINNQIIIVGSGPAGLFAGYMLAKAGYKPLIIERGEDIDNRVKTVEKFWETGKLNLNSNVQFGAGGAGTFSDGKLNTGHKDIRNKEVLRIFVQNGAPKDILYLNKPHIGTDLLRDVIKNMIEKIIKMGGEIKYNTCLTNIITDQNKLTHIEINHQKTIPCDNLILALGHSSRDTFEMLLKQGLNIVAKPFAVGLRIQHPQFLINYSQYGTNHLNLPPASYKLTYQTSKKRGVYTFCMCPGGYVVNASSEKNMLVVNGMSNHNRNSENANSAIIVTISPEDYGKNPLDGINFQRKLEKKAYEIGGGNIPVQLFKDFVQNKPSQKFNSINPIFKGNYVLTNLRGIFPPYISEALIEGIQNFGKKIKGFDCDDAILAACESRTSSPIKILRDENLTSNIQGIYPCGEGAGYAGGIMTSAIDGIKIAEILIKNYKPL